ncbi:MAG TPA: hypothetical protein VF174_07325 [Micromonosporaceae bacterium]
MLSVQVRSGRDLGAVRQALREVGAKGLGKQLSQGLRKAARPLVAEVRKELPTTMPSGYAPTLSRSLRHRTTVRSRRMDATVVWQLYGAGRKSNRDVAALNRGTLRHPVFGRRSRWVAQPVRPGMVDRPVDRLGPEITRQMQAVVDDIAARITRG